MSRPSCCGPRFSNLPPPHRDQAIDLTHVSVRLGNILTCAHAHDLRITCAFQATAARVVGPPRLGGSPHRTQAAMSLDAPVVKLRRRDSAALGGVNSSGLLGAATAWGSFREFFYRPLTTSHRSRRGSGGNHPQGRQCRESPTKDRGRQIQRLDHSAHRPPVPGRPALWNAARSPAIPSSPDTGGAPSSWNRSFPGLPGLLQGHFRISPRPVRADQFHCLLRPPAS